MMTDFLVMCQVLYHLCLCTSKLYYCVYVSYKVGSRNFGGRFPNFLLHAHLNLGRSGGRKFLKIMCSDIESGNKFH